MSSVDTRIVEMEFDNRQFEKGIQTSMRSLKDFKESLDFKGATKGLDELERAGKNFSLPGLATVTNSCDKLLSRFKAIIEYKFFDRLEYQARGLVRSLSIDQVTAGWTKYNQKTQSVQTIMNATGKSIDEVNKYLDKLMWFSDETSYSFTDMTQSLGQLTTSGGDIEKLIPMIEGIANATAFAGKGTAEFSRAIYNLNQSYGAGNLQYMDWRSLELAGVASEQLKQIFIDTGIELGKIHEGEVTIANFGSTLQKKWATTEVMEKSFGKFAEMTEKAYEMVNSGQVDTASEAYEILAKEYDGIAITAAKAAQEAKSFNEAIESVKDAVSSGFMKSFELIIGNYEEAKVLWTDVANALWEVFAADSEVRNEMLQGWHDLKIGGREDLIKGLYDAFEGLWGIIQAIKAGIKEIIPDVTIDKLQKLTLSVKNFGKSFKEAFSYEKVVTKNPVKRLIGDLMVLDEELNKGSRGDSVKELQKRLMELNYLGANEDDGIFGSKTEAALVAFQKDMGIASDGVYDLTTKVSLLNKLGLDTYVDEQAESVNVYGKSLSRIKDIASSFASIIKFVGSVIKTAFGTVVKVIKTLNDLRVFDALLSILAFIGRAVTSFTNFVRAGGLFGKIINLISNGIVKLKTALSEASTKIIDFFDATPINDFRTLFEKLSESIDKNDIGGKIIKKFSAIRDFIKSFGRGVKESLLSKLFGESWNSRGVTNGFVILENGQRVMVTFSMIVEQITNRIKALSSKIKSYFGLFKPILKPFAEIIKSFYNEKVTGLKESIFERLFGNKQTSSIKENFSILQNGKQIAAALVDSLSKLGGKASVVWSHIKKILLSIPNYGKRFVDFLSKLGGSEKGKTGILSAATRIYSGIKDRLSKIDGLSGMLKAVGSFFESVIGGFLDLISTPAYALTEENIGKVEKTADAIETGVDALSGAKEKVDDVVDGISKVIGGSVSSESTDKAESIVDKLSGIGSTFSTVWSKIKDKISSALSFIDTAYDKVGFGGIIGIISFALTGSLTFKLGNAAAKLIRNVGKVVGSFIGLGDNVKGFVDAYGGIGKSVSDLVTNKGGGIFDSISSMLTNIGNLKNIGKEKTKLSSIAKSILELSISIGIIVASMIYLGKEITKNPEVVKTGAKSLGIIVGAMLGLALITRPLNVLSGASFKTLSSSLLKVSFGFIAFYRAIKLFAKLDADTFLKGLIGIFGIVLALRPLINSVAKSYNGVSMKGFVGFAVGLLGMVAVMAIIGKMELGRIAKGLTGLFFMLLELSIAVRIATKATGSVRIKGLVGFAVSLLALVGVLAIIGNMKFDVLLKGFVGLTILLGMLAIIMVIVSKSKNSTVKIAGLIGVSLSLLTLVGVIAIIGRMPIATISKGVFGLVPIMIAISAVIKAAGSVGSFKGTIAVLMSAVAFASIAAVFIGSLYMLEKYDTERIASVGLVFSTLIGVLSLAAGISKFVGVSGFASLGAGILIIAGVIVALLSAFSLINKLPGAKEMLTGALVDIFTSFGEAIGAMNAAMIKATASNLTDMPEIDQEGLNRALAAMTSIQTFADGFSSFSIEEGIANRIAGGSPFQLFCDAIPGFATSIMLVSLSVSMLPKDLPSKVKTATDAATHIQKLANGLDDVTIADAIYEKFTGESAFSKFCKTIPTFARSILLVSPLLSLLPDDLSSKVKTATDSATYIQELANGLDDVTIADAIYEKFTGESAFSKFCKTIPTFVRSIMLVSPLLSLLPDDLSSKVKTATDAATYIQELSNGLDAITIEDLLYEKFTGESAFSKFCKTMPLFALEVARASSYFKLIPEDAETNTEKATTIAGSIQELALKCGTITIDDILAKIFEVGSPFETFCNNLTTFATSVKTYAGSIKGFSTDTEYATLEDDTTRAVDICTSIGDFFAAIEGLDLENRQGFLVRLFTGENSVDSFFLYLGDLITRINDLKPSLSGLSESTIATDAETAKSVLQTFADFFTYLSDEETNLNSTLAVDNSALSYADYFTNAMWTIMDTIRKISEEILETTDYTKFNDIATSVQAMADGLASFASVDVSKIDETAIGEKASALASAVSTSFSEDQIDTSGITNAISDCAAGINGYYGQFYQSGKHLTSGVEQGIKDGTGAVAAAGIKMVRLALAAMNHEAEIKSPSRKTYWSGKMMVFGLVNSIRDYTGYVNTAASEMSSSAIGTVQNTLSNLGNVLLDDMDSDPVIRPVVDLSNVTSSASAISGMLGTNQSFGISADVSRTMAASASKSSSKAIQNGTTGGQNSGITNSSAVNLSGNNFYIRSEQDIRSLASEIAVLSAQEQRSLGSAVR